MFFHAFFEVDFGRRKIRAKNLKKQTFPLFPAAAAVILDPLGGIKGGGTFSKYCSARFAPPKGGRRIEPPPGGSTAAHPLLAASRQRPGQLVIEFLFCDTRQASHDSARFRQILIFFRLRTVSERGFEAAVAQPRFFTKNL